MAYTYQKNRSRKTSNRDINNRVKKARKRDSSQTKINNDIWYSKETNIPIINNFEKMNQRLTHKKCNSCRSVSICLNVKKPSKTSNVQFCSVCQKYGFSKDEEHPEWLPTWTDSNGTRRFDLPNELKDLREGEKLLIQKVAPYVPIHHL